MDIDVTPDTDQANLRRLSDALHELGARIRTEADPKGLPFDHDGTSLARATIWNLICPAGPFDLSFIPSGTDGYADLAWNARVVVVEGIQTPLADLADVVRSKRAANRPKGLEVSVDPYVPFGQCYQVISRDPASPPNGTSGTATGR